MMKIRSRKITPKFKPKVGVTCISGDGLEWIFHSGYNEYESWSGQNVWQVKLDLLPLPTISGLPDIPLLHDRINSIKNFPEEVVNKMRSDQPVILGPLTIDLWPEQISGDGSFESNYLEVDSEDGYNLPRRKVLDTLQNTESLIGLKYKLTRPYFIRGLLWKELDNFINEAKEFLSVMKIYLSFDRQINTLYRNNFRQNFDGDADLHKITGEISKFLRHESVALPSEVYGWTEKDRRDEVATKLAWIANQNLGNQPKPVVQNGVQFEEEVANKLEALDFVIDRTPVIGDFGADLLAQKDDLRYAIQCKAHSRPIGIKAVQEAVGSRQYYKCDYGVVVASSSFTPAAQELAQETRVILISDDDLARLEFLIDS